MYYCVHCSGPGAAAGHQAAARAGPVLGRPVRAGGQRGHPQHGRPGAGGVDSEPVNTYPLQILGFCGGRVDAVDGSESIQLGPSALQEELAPCESLGLQVGPRSAVTTLVTTAASRTESASCRWAPTPWASSTSTPRVTWQTGTRSRAPGTSGRCSPGGGSKRMSEFLVLHPVTLILPQYFDNLQLQRSKDEALILR